MISRKALVDFGADHSDAADPLDRWYRVAKKAAWANFAEVRADFGSADQVGDHAIFNIAGNKFRLVALIFYNRQVLLVRGVYTHKEYDKLQF